MLAPRAPPPVTKRRRRHLAPSGGDGTLIARFLKRREILPPHIVCMHPGRLGGPLGACAGRSPLTRVEPDAAGN